MKINFNHLDQYVFNVNNLSYINNDDGRLIFANGSSVIDGNANGCLKGHQGKWKWECKYRSR